MSDHDFCRCVPWNTRSWFFHSMSYTIPAVTRAHRHVSFGRQSDFQLFPKRLSFFKVNRTHIRSAVALPRERVRRILGRGGNYVKSRENCGDLREPNRWINSKMTSIILEVTLCRLHRSHAILWLNPLLLGETTYFCVVDIRFELRLVYVVHLACEKNNLNFQTIFVFFKCYFIFSFSNLIMPRGDKYTFFSIILPLFYLKYNILNLNTLWLCTEE